MIKNLRRAKIFAIIFVIFAWDDIHYILVKFESERVHRSESPKNGRIGARELKLKKIGQDKVQIRYKNCQKKKFWAFQNDFEI